MHFTHITYHQNLQVGDACTVCKEVRSPPRSMDMHVRGKKITVTASDSGLTNN